MTITGGMRARLIRESLYQMLHDALDALNWFDAVSNRTTITFPAAAVDANDNISLNTLALSDEDSDADDWELGSLMAEHHWTFYVDFYAENDAIGLHVIRDVKDILEGRMGSIGRDDPSFVVYDYNQATPPEIAVCQIADVVVDKARGFERAFQQHWYACQFDVIDYYGDEDA